MSHVLSEEKKQQVIALGKLGWPLRRIEQATGVRRETASAYLKAAGVIVRLPRFWGKRMPSKPAKEVTPDLIGPFSQKPGSPSAPSPPSASVCEAYREQIQQSLARGRNGKAIWQDLVSEHGFSGDYQAVKRFVRKLRGPQQPEAAGIILTGPGEEAQVDYGSGPMVRDPQSGKYRRTRLFVLTLGYSRKAVRLLRWRSNARTWAELHEQAFRRLGGSTRVVVLDNLREGVSVPDIYDPILNPLFRDVLAHYGVVALPCRIQDLIYQRQQETGIRRILGILSLIKKYGAASVEDACAAALELNIHEYRFVRRYLERRPHPQMFLRQIDPLIRKLTEYRDFIHLKQRSKPNEPDRVEPCLASAALGWHGCRAGDPLAASPSRTDGPDRLAFLPGVG
jgi:hypothetical protein